MAVTNGSLEHQHKTSDLVEKCTAQERSGSHVEDLFVSGDSGVAPVLDRDDPLVHFIPTSL